MEKEILEQSISLNLSQREIAKQFNTSQSNIKYWLKKHSLKTKFNQHNKSDGFSTEKYCPKCEKTQPIENFYKRTNRSDRNGYCKICSNKYCGERVKNVKIRMIEYKGGCCENCKLKLIDSHYSVYDIHHTNPENKDPNFNGIKCQKWEVIKNEIDKCILLCANCHRIEHSKNS